MSEGIKFLTAVVPELEGKPIEEVKRLWREWVNNQPPDVRLWLKDPLSPSQRRTLQFGFAAEYYQTHMLVAFENTQEERRQKFLAQDPRNQPHVPVLEAARRDFDEIQMLTQKAIIDRDLPILQAAESALGPGKDPALVERTLPDGSVIFAMTEDEADAIVARELEKSAEDTVGIPDALDGGGVI